MALVLIAACGICSGAATLEVTNSISETLAAAAPGDTVRVRGPRVFHEHVVMSKPVHLVGSDWPVLDADGSGTPLTVSAAGAEISGLVLRNSGADLAHADSGIMITAPNTHVSNCRVENNAFGIYLRAATDCIIEANNICGDPSVPAAQRGNGVHLWKTRGNQIRENSIHDKRDGIYLSYADENTLAGNQVRDTRFGIHYMYSQRNRLLTNSLTRNSVGATLMFSREALVQGNSMLANRRHGLVLKQLDNSRIIGNRLVGQNRGLFVQQSGQNRFERNLIATNDIGLYLSGSEENVFVGNAFVQNTDQVWLPTSEADQGQLSPNRFYEKGQGNFWSDYVGSDRNQDGVGDTPYHETDVFGHIVDRHPEARLLALSPAVSLLRQTEERFPLLDTTGVIDLYPLMHP